MTSLLMLFADSESTSAADDDEPSGTASNDANTTGPPTAAEHQVNRPRVQ